MRILTRLFAAVLHPINQKLSVARHGVGRLQLHAIDLDLGAFSATPAREFVAPAGMLTPAASRGDGAAASEAHESDDVTTVLVVDDDPMFRALIRHHLTPRYRVIEAADGMEGLAHARAQQPDLILSDVIMPNMGGFILCRTLKEDTETEFIPVVLLTARADVEGRIKGLGEHADDYLTKPFDVRELRARIDNLVASRRRLHERFHSAGTRPSSAGLGELQLAPVRVDTSATIILRRVRESVEAHLSDEEFSVERLAAVLGVSRGHLHRQLKELLGQTPSATIRIMRLERAAQLLAARSGTVSEVAYAVGFRSLAHFSNAFDAHYGCRPSLYPPRNAD